LGLTDTARNAIAERNGPWRTPRPTSIMRLLRGIVQASRHVVWYVDYQCGGNARSRH
jgi:hypothetical protein